MRAWRLTSREILRIGDAPQPDILTYDSTFAYRGHEKTAHGGTLTLPDGSKVPVALMSFASAKDGRPFFVMAAPQFWEEKGVDSKEVGRKRLLTAVFLHEFAHTRQIPALGRVIGPIEKEWKGTEEISDDIVQHQFESNAAYKADYEAERDLLYRAADASSIEETRRLAGEAVDRIKARRARWFTGGDAVFATLDEVFLSFEGAGQMVAYKWLIHPRGGNVPQDVAIAAMRRGKKQWTQDEGFALFLILEKLLPDWPQRVFSAQSAGALELLEAAVSEGRSPMADRRLTAAPTPRSSSARSRF